MNNQTKIGHFRLGHFASAVLLAVSSAWSGQTLADDTEVFFPPVQVEDEETVRPNIMFIMDTSGSMGSRDGGSGTPTRLEKVQSAMIELLQGMNQNVNVGLMRLSDDEGGPVLFPISHIEAPADSVLEGGSCDVDNGVGVIPPLVGVSEKPEDWSYERQTNGASFPGQPFALAGGALGIAGGAQTNSLSRRVNGDGDAERQNGAGSEYNGDGDDDLDLAHDGELDAIVRFRNIDIPKNAYIIDARITFKQSGYGNQAQSNTAMNVTAHYVDDSNDPGNGNFTDRLSDDTRGEAGGLVDWSGDGVFPDADSQDEPITTPNLASLVQLLVNRSGWSSGNAISFLFEGRSGHFSVWSGDKGGNRRPLLEISYSNSPPVVDVMTAGFRFPAMNVPQGVAIESATLSLTPDVSLGSLLSGLAFFKVEGEKSADAKKFENAVNDVTSRPPTSKFENISIANAGLLGLGQSIDVDVTEIVQEIAAQGAWCGGNAMAFTVSPYLTNVAQLKFETYLSNAEKAPQLRVELKQDAASLAQIKNGCQARAVASQIDASDDDAEQESNGYVRFNDDQLDNARDPYVGLRFNDLQVLNGAEILDARLEMTAWRSDNGNAPTVSVHTEVTPDADRIETEYSSDLSERFNANASSGVDWPLGDWSEDSEYRSPNLKDIVQSVVDQGAWAPGNSMLFLIKDQGGDGRLATSYDQSPSKAPRLYILSRGGTGTITEETVRERLIKSVEDFQDQGTTPLAEVLTEAAYYYRGDNVHFGRTRGSGLTLNQDGQPSSQNDLAGANEMRISHCSTYTGGQQFDPPGCSEANLNDDDCEEQRITGNPVYRSPINQGCQSNNIVLLSDGEPNNNTENDLIYALTGKNSCVGGGNGGCGIDLAAWLNANDQSDAFTGDQKITTYTIGFGDDVGGGSSGGNYLAQMASAGGGSFFEAGESADLIQAFQTIVAEILDKNTTFVAPAVTINSFNRLSHLDQLYFALFQPRSEPRWPGNLKRFRLQPGDNSVVDVNGNDAVDGSTGFFKDSARSFWTSSGNDGGVVAKGGAEEQMPSPASRLIYSNLSGSNLTTIGNRVTEGNSAITATMLGVDGTSNPSAQRTAVLRWARGFDVDDADQDNSTTDAREQIIGDPLHSEPVVVDYGGTEANPDLAIFMGTNQGNLHAFDSRTGEELYSFVPKELLGNFSHYRNNFGAHSSRPYGMDGPIVVDQSDSSKKILVAGMRRGGKSYYALDVTSKTSPQLLWTIKGGQGDYAALAQSWSRPVIANVKIGGASKKVLIIGGGYDTQQDTPNSTPITDSTGQMIYMVDIEDGSLVWSAGNPGNNPDLEIAAMTSSVPASPRVIDLDFDGLIDRMYFGDMNGQVFRIDFFKDNSGLSDMAKGYLYADLGGADAANNRRFYNEVDVALIESQGVESFLSLSIGSGYRSHPLEEGVQDRFYVLKDYDTARVSEDSSNTDIYRKPYFEIARDFDSNLDGTLQDSEKGQELGLIYESELVDASTDSATVRDQFGRARGGFINMRAGEKVLTIARTFDNTVIFSTFQPSKSTGNICKAGEGTSRLYQIDVTNLGPKLFKKDPPTKGRDSELPQGGIPPNPVILFPESDSGVPEEAVICVGPFCTNPGLPVTTTKTWWREN